MKLFADSACDLPLSFLQENGVAIAPLTVLLDSGEYVDMFEAKPEMVYEMIEKGGHPKTSQVPLEKFLSLFRPYAERGENGLYIGLSAELSGTFQAAHLAYTQLKDQFPDFDLRLIDSKNASLGTGELVYEAVRLQETGASLDEIETRIRSLVDEVVSIFTVSDLNYLAEGGRLSRSGAFLGGLLNIQPLLQVIDGKLVAVEKIRGRKKVIKRMYERIQQEALNPGEQTVMIVHANEDETAQEMKEYLKKNLKPKEILVHQIGAVVVGQAGLGTIGLFYYKNY